MVGSMGDKSFSNKVGGNTKDRYKKIQGHAIYSRMGFSCRCSIFCTNIGNGLFEAIDPTNVNRFTFVGASVIKQHFFYHILIKKSSFWNPNKKHDFLLLQTSLVYFPSLFKDIQLSNIHADFVFSLWFCKESSDIFQFLLFSFPFRILFFQMLSVQCSSSSTLCI